MIPLAVAELPAQSAGAFAEVMSRGGILMWPLLALSVISVTLSVERFFFWLGLNGGGRSRWLAELTTSLRTGNRVAAERLLRGGRSAYAALAAALLDGGASEAVAIEAVERERPRIDRFMAALSTIITAAPMLGILGTVIGIIQSFELLGQESTISDPRQVSTGIAEALITTAAGLVVALVTLFPYMAFRGQADRAVGRFEMIIAAAESGFPPDPRPSTDGNAQASGNTAGEDPPGDADDARPEPESVTESA